MENGKYKKIDNIFKGCSSLLSFPDISKWNYNNINDKINLNNVIEESLSSKYSSNKGNISFSDNINSSQYFNNPEKSDLNNTNEYKEELIDFYFKDDSLISYYDNFYS